MKIKLSLIASLSLSVAFNIHADPFTAGNLALVQVGDGSAALNNASTSIFINEYSLIGTLVQSIAIPNSGGSAMTVSGSATSEGALNRSANNQFLVFNGYNSVSGVSGIASSTSATVARNVGTVNAAGVFSVGATTSSQFSGNNIRSGASDGAGNFWAAGGNSGTYYMGNNNSPATVQSASANTRVV